MRNSKRTYKKAQWILRDYGYKAQENIETAKWTQRISKTLKQNQENYNKKDKLNKGGSIRWGRRT
jgi:hypothetical protein